MKITKILLLAIVILLFSCQVKDEKQQKKIILSDGSGYRLVNFHIKEKDTILEDFYDYDKKNKLKHVGKYVNNKIYGKYKEYYPNGNIESIRFIENNNDMGEARWYYLNGQIEQYSFYDDFGRTIFKAQYDKDGVLKIAEGWILLEIYQNKLRANGKQRKYYIGDKIKYQYMFPNIPNTDRKFHIELKGYDNSKIKRKTRHIEPVTLEIEEEVVKKGKNEIIAYVEYKFKDVRREILRDSVSFEFDVR